MSILKKLLLLLSFIGTSTLSFSQTVFMLGPIVHFNFGEHKPRISYGFECSYWDVRYFNYGVDVGAEYESEKFRIYSELETGVGIAGVAAGPVFELNTTENKTHLGFQGSVWTNFFLGFQYRKRWIDKTMFNCAGIYAKVPFIIGKNTASETQEHWGWN